MLYLGLQFNCELPVTVVRFRSQPTGRSRTNRHVKNPWSALGVSMKPLCFEPSGYTESSPHSEPNKYLNKVDIYYSWTKLGPPYTTRPSRVGPSWKNLLKPTWTSNFWTKCSNLHGKILILISITQKLVVVVAVETLKVLYSVYSCVSLNKLTLQEYHHNLCFSGFV